MMTGGSRMNIIPKEILVRIDGGIALCRIHHVDEAVFGRLTQDTNYIQPNIEGVNLNGDAADGERALRGGNHRIEVVTVDRGIEIERGHSIGITKRIRDGA